MPRAATRSQKAAPRASQSQPRSQTQRGARRRNEDFEENDGDDSAGGGPQSDGEGAAGMDEDNDQERGDGETEIRRKANELVRLALFTENKRVPLRRDDITKKVLGPNTRAFNHVYDIAQDILRKTFGMELVELQSRAGLDKDASNANEDELNEARNATGVRKKAAAAGSKTYILRSVLDPIIIEHAALTDEQIYEEEHADAPSEDEDDPEDGTPVRSYGSIISWSTSDQLGPTAILYTILSLILVSGRAMTDMDLRSSLKRLRLPPTGDIAFNTQSTHRTVTVDQYLSTLIRQGYLDRQQIGENTKKGKGAKRGRATQADEDAGITYEWRWGNRAQSEIGEKGIAQFVAEFMVGDAGDDGDDESEDEAATGRGAKRRQDDTDTKITNMMKGIERAAGGQLAGLR
ncbi:MAGE family-domain-containing protein [Collybia nuda]|uniref:MAGE family-domain-containing protein n=1 Tax=Collybia nuda TaxID=64659 RepID=A0A9P6CLX1_9AGAR|nr:MAGE family-domain-containing protein [Collybia nuda]